MQHLNRLIQLASAASQVAELVRHVETFQFRLATPDTLFYLHAAAAEVALTRWEADSIEVEAQLQAPFGWRVETDQDEAGVYFVARRRPVVGGLAGARFAVRVPQATFCTLKLEGCTLALDNQSGTYTLSPDGKISVSSP